ncbi:unnamed protein product, partial [Darwinula stevensoni]
MRDLRLEVDRHIELDELKNLKSEFEGELRNVQSSLNTTVNELNHEVRHVFDGNLAQDHDAMPTLTTYKPIQKHWRVKQVEPREHLEPYEAHESKELGNSVEEEFAPEEAFISHLTELRTRMMIAVGAVLVCFLGLAYWAPQIFNIISEPLAKTLPKGSKMIVTDVTGSFFTPLKVTLYVAFVIALPVVLYQIWAFVAPGLYRHEKRFIFPLVLSSFLLFIAGMAFASFFVLPTVFKFMALASTHLQAAEMATDIEKYL